MYEKLKELAQKRKIVRVFLIALIAVRVFFKLVIKYCSFFNEDGSVNERAKALARKSKFARYFLVCLIAVRVFCNQIKKHYFNSNKQSSEAEGNWLCRWKIAFGVCAAMVAVICCDSIIDTYAAVGKRQDEGIVDVEKAADLESKMKPVQEVSFHYTRGIGKKLYEESGDSESSEKAEDALPVNESVLESGNLKMTVKTPGFDGDLYEGDDEKVYSVVIKNDGDEEIIGVQIKTDLMQLSGYDDMLAEILLRDSEDEEEYTESESEAEESEAETEISKADEAESETEENRMDEYEYASEESKQEENETGEPVSDKESSEEEIEEPDINEAITGSVEEQVENEAIEPQEESLALESEDASDASDVSENSVSVSIEENMEIEALEDLCFSLKPGEEVTVYLKVPEECMYGIYSDIIEIMAEESELSCSIEVPIRVYAKEGLPWQTTPDRTKPVIYYVPDEVEQNAEITDVFEFAVLENEEYDSGIEKVECYLNGNLLELQPEIVDTAKRDGGEVVTNAKYRVQFIEEGINNLIIKASDCEGNEAVQSLDVQVVKEEDYHVVMPQKIELTVDPAMAYGSTQIYNLRDFAIENDSVDNLLVSIEEINVTVKNGQEKQCSLNMAVIVDGEEVQSVPVNDVNSDNACDFVINGKGIEGKEIHKAYLVFTGMLENEDDDWHEGDLDVKIQVKLTEVK